MRVIAWVLIAVTVVTLCVFGYGVYALRIQPGDLMMVVAPAAEAPEQFEQLRAGLENRSLTGRVYQDAPLGNPEEYVFVTYVLRVKNIGFVPAEWIELTITPENGDVLEAEGASAQVLGAMSTGDLKKVILQKGDGTDTVRAAKVTYYAFGREYTVDVPKK